MSHSKDKVEWDSIILDVEKDDKSLITSDSKCKNKFSFNGQLIISNDIKVNEFSALNICCAVNDIN